MVPSWFRSKGEKFWFDESFGRTVTAILGSHVVDRLPSVSLTAYLG